MFNKVKTVIKSLVKGIKKGWVTSTLPEYITKFHNKAIVRLFRFLGGLSVIITLGKVNFSFNVPIYIFYISFFITILFFVYMLGINIIRLIHIIKILRSDELDVRNSPLDRIASLTARILLCGKGICVGGAVGGSVVGAGLALDSSLINTGNEPIFSPQFVGLLKKILPEGVIKSTSSNSSITSIEIGSILSKLDSNQLDQVGLKDIKNDIVKAKALSLSEKNELENLINQEQLNLEKKEAYLKSKIKEEIEKLKK